ncbi:MarR family winged helix-turn-helix transcriptional regulator [Clostridium algidicarnis]|uniref:MarR family transcriptional regulator n=2 Tax=Clostridium algidicarnis TaxID=37659 RepID=A0A2S6FZ28_9CLOT|nr:MarR family transcriptional regulator [Clostridium algidicarnis]MBB6630088.1 MarR family transcriptional regulator [Clostridium algidicarnis]MBB6696908.1 MarR family transcriptional regulator [Clostridium algidicarnis]MBU3193257.1 MarR family transcriptional regulator [Clostridium algidicarnis]MBU3196938.1 MarR family transcriptional regulator [Clostridium algidicarnis]MBU3204613.1 MarR family transcriptional regulator [Clostridium algidicarnis]
MNEDILNLDNQLCFSIYACSKEIIRLYRPFLEKLGLTYTQYIALLALWEKDKVTVKELGNRLYLDSGTLTPLLKKMEENGLLLRERQKDDERKVLITLTKAGVDLRQKALEIPKSILCSTNLDKEKSIELREDIKSLLKHIYAINEETVSKK